MRSILLFICLSGLLSKGISQSFIEPDKMKSFNVTVNYSEYTVKTQMLKDPKKMTPDVNLTYHWYTAQKIMETKGGYDGKLLHGYYHSFYLTDQLFESGQFKYGVKNGEWKNWYPNGKIKEVTHWKNGRKNGKYSLYNEFGLLMATGKFRRDELEGEFKTYDAFGKESSIRKYKRGKEIIKKQKVKKEKAKKEKVETETSKSHDNDKAKQGDTVKPKKEKKRLFGKKKEGSISPDVTKKEKKTFGQKIKSIFKRKPKNKEEKKTSKKTSVTT